MTINQFLGKHWTILDENTRDEIQSILNPVHQLHCALFPEETDYMLDDRFDKELRKEGINPMNEKYQAKVMAKRETLGVTPLNQAGLAVDNSSWELCTQIISDTFKY